MKQISILILVFFSAMLFCACDTGNGNEKTLANEDNQEDNVIEIEKELFILTIEISGYGKVEYPLKDAYPKDTEVTLYAIPDEGYSFSHWEGDAAGSSSTVSIIMTKNMNVRVVFSKSSSESSIIIDHNCRILSEMPAEWIVQAKSSLHIAYQHTSHGSQISTGMLGLASWKGSLYSFNNGGTTTGALDLSDYAMQSYGASDLGNPNGTAWASATRAYLNNNPKINVVMWSWCGQVSAATQADINTYLSLMSQLELEFPNVIFVYMTGHVDGTGINGNCHKRNEQIREFCRLNSKILYDFADIESFDPEGVFYLDKYVLDTCYYDANENNNPWDDTANWAVIWQNSHIKGVDWYECESAHSQPVNANLKAYAAWWMFARISGWDPE
jgi:hypothetical protein